MAHQTGRNILVAYKVESVFNTPPVATGANRFRANPSPGLRLTREEIRSNEIRADGMSSFPRSGSKVVNGSYSADLSVGTFDPLFEAVFRSTWVAAVVITEATAGLTSITTTTNTIVAAAGSWITAGVRVGDVIRLTNHATAANNNINLRVTGVTASTITVAETLTANAVADTAFTITVAKKLVQGTTNRTFTFEEYNGDIDLTEQSTGVGVSSLRLTGAPNGMGTVEFGLVGTDMAPLATGASPFFTSTTLSTSIGLTMIDASIRFGAATVTNLTAFEVMLDLGIATQPVIGSTTTPALFPNNASVTGSISGTRQDLTNLTRFTAETELEFHALIYEPEVEPKDYISVFIPRLKIMGVDKSIGSDGAMIETMPFEAGAKETATGYDNTMIALYTSAA